MAEIEIIQRPSIVNTTESPGRSIEYIVLHFTASTDSSKGAARAIADWFANVPNVSKKFINDWFAEKARASTDFIVDDEEIIQYNTDAKNRYCWSVGGEKYKTMTTSLGGTLYGICTNANSMSIEMCSSKKNPEIYSDVATDWYLTDAVVDNAVKLTRYLMDLYDIDIDHVVMHHHVTGKVCPNPWVVDEDHLVNWYAFLKRLQD